MHIKYYSILILFLFACCNLNAQYDKQEYPFNLDYTANKEFNIRLSISRNTNFESEYVFFEMPSISFSVIQNPYNKKEFFFSLNPLVWAISTLTNSGKMVNSGGGMPLLNVFLEGIPNLKFDILLFKDVYLDFGLDLDYLASNKSIGLRGGFATGIKAELNNLSLKLMYNWETTGFASYYKDFNSVGVRINFSYDLGSNSFSKYVYYCGATN
jgi:hypothetical protein